MVSTEDTRSPIPDLNNHPDKPLLKRVFERRGLKGDMGLVGPSKPN